VLESDVVVDGADPFGEAADGLDGVATDDVFEIDGAGLEELFGARGVDAESELFEELSVDTAGVEVFPASVVFGEVDGICMVAEVLVIVVLDWLAKGVVVLDLLAEVWLFFCFPLNSAFNSFCSGVSVLSVSEVVLLDAFAEVLTAGAETLGCRSDMLEELEETFAILIDLLVLVPLPRVCRRSFCNQPFIGRMLPSKDCLSQLTQRLYIVAWAHPC